MKSNVSLVQTRLSTIKRARSWLQDAIVDFSLFRKACPNFDQIVIDLGRAMRKLLVAEKAIYLHQPAMHLVAESMVAVRIGLAGLKRSLLKGTQFEHISRAVNHCLALLSPLVGRTLETFST